MWHIRVRVSCLDRWASSSASLGRVVEKYVSGDALRAVDRRFRDAHTAFRRARKIVPADGNFPADMSLSTSEGLEEERRLMYVALTRARDVLSVYVPLRYHHKRAGVGDRHSYAPISRFLAPVRSLFDESSDGSGTDGHDREEASVGGHLNQRV